MITPSRIVDLYNSRVAAVGHEQQVLREIQDLYQGDIVVPLPELGADERPAIPNIARTGIDQVGQRIASVFPEIDVRPSGPSRQSQKRAQERRRAFYAFHEHNRTQRLLRRLSRYLIGYASAPVQVGVNFDAQVPTLRVRSPLGMYAAPSGDPDQFVPDDVIFASTQSMSWLGAKFPDAHRQLFRRDDDAHDTAIDILEYMDPEGTWLVASRRGTSDGSRWDYQSAINDQRTHISVDHAALAFVPNRMGETPVIVPGAITLGPRRSPYHQIIGMYQASAEMDAWSRHATAKGVNAPEWLIGYQGDEPELVRAADPLDGVVGIVKGGNLESRPVQPQFAARASVSDMERASRLTAGLPAELGGEAATNVRTGKRGDQLLSAVLDFPVQEAHQLIEETIENANRQMALTDLHFFRNVPKVWAVKFGGEKGDLSYQAGDLWTRNNAARTPAVESDVSYFMAGVDAGDRIISLGQRLGMGTISQETVMRHDPVVDDVQGELSKITSEELRRAFMTQIQTLAADPNSPLATSDIKDLIKLTTSGLPIEEAWEKVEKAAIEREQQAQAQAAQQSPGGPAGPGGPPQQTIEGAGAVPPAIGEVPEGVGNLAGLLNGLRSQSAFAGPQG